MERIDPLAVLKAFVNTFRTQDAAAAALGISQGNLSDMLRGNRGCTRVLPALGLEAVIVRKVKKGKAA